MIISASNASFIFKSKKKHSFDALLELNIWEFHSFVMHQIWNSIEIHADVLSFERNLVWYQMEIAKCRGRKIITKAVDRLEFLAIPFLVKIK